MSEKPKIAFICTYNPAVRRWQRLSVWSWPPDAFEAYSAGAEIKKEIKSAAVCIIQKLYGVDMTATQHPKLLSALPKMDIVVTMVYRVSAPICLESAGKIGDLMIRRNF